MNKSILEKLIVPHLVKIIPLLYGTRKVIIIYMRRGHMSVKWARRIQSMHTKTIIYRYIWYSPLHLRLLFPRYLFTSAVHSNKCTVSPLSHTFHNNKCTVSPLSHTFHTPRPPHPSWFHQPNKFLDQYRSWNFSLCISTSHFFPRNPYTNFLKTQFPRTSLCITPSKRKTHFTHIQSDEQNYFSLYFNFYISK